MFFSYCHMLGLGRQVGVDGERFLYLPKNGAKTPSFITITKDFF